MTRAQTKRFEKEVEKQNDVEAREHQEYRRASTKVAKNLIAVETFGDDADGPMGPVDTRENPFRKEPRRRGVIYLRVSSEAQSGEDKVSLSEQRIVCYEYCDINNIEVIAVFCDVVPGRFKLKDMPDFQRMLDEIRKGGIDVVVCWKGDRLARAVSPANALLEALEGTDTQLEAVREHIDRTYFVLMAWFGGIELGNFRDRSMLGKRGRAKAGMIPCRQICFGYDVDEAGYPILNEKNAETVRYIFKLYVEEGLGMIRLTKRLNSEGIPAARGGKWGYGVVHTILAQPAYIGTWYYGRRRWEYLEQGVRKSEQPEDMWIGVKVPKIVDEMTWHRAQQLKKERRKNSGRNTRTFYLLQHLMTCEPCGRMIGCRKDDRKRIYENGKVRRVKMENPKHHHRFYLCHGQQRDGYKCRTPGSVAAQTLEDAIWSATKHILRNPGEYLSDIESQPLDDDKRNSLHAEVRRVRRVLDDENSAKSFVIRRGALGKLTEEELDEQLNIIRDRIAQYEALLTDLLDQENMVLLEERQRVQITDYLSSISQIVDDLTKEQRRELLKNLYSRISIDGQNAVTLTVALPGDPVPSFGI